MTNSICLVVDLDIVPASYCVALSLLRLNEE